MKKGLVNIAQGTPETLDNLKLFLIESKKTYPEKKLKTLESAVNFAIEQAEKVPALEEENALLKKRVSELEKQLVEDRAMRG